VILCLVYIRKLYDLEHYFRGYLNILYTTNFTNINEHDYNIYIYYEPRILLQTVFVVYCMYIVGATENEII
jgi:hypothetical protein